MSCGFTRWEHCLIHLEPIANLLFIFLQFTLFTAPSGTKEEESDIADSYNGLPDKHKAGVCVIYMKYLDIMAVIICYFISYYVAHATRINKINGLE